MKKMLTFAMLLMTSVVYAQDSSIFIEQTGQNLTMNINQAGNGNQIGDMNSSEPFKLNGSQQNILINQLGSNNSLFGEIFGNSINAQMYFTGDNNQMSFLVNPEGMNSAEAGTYIFNVTGSNNTFDFQVANDAVADNVAFDWEIVGDFNVFTSTVNSDNYTSNIASFGSYNNYTLVSSGASGHSLDINQTGDYTNFTISQTATLETNTIQLQTNTSGTANAPSTICIYQSDSGTTGC